MEERTTVVIDIQLDEGKVAERLAAVNDEMDNLKETNKELRKEIKAGNDAMGENSKQLAANEAKLKTLGAEQNALKGKVAQLTQNTRNYGTSLKEQSALLNDLRNRYQSLDETQRNSKGGQKLLKEIKDLDKALKDADAQQGIFGRNVGDYANKMAEAFDKAGVSVGGVKKKFDLLNTNPIMFTLGLLVGLLVKLRDKMQEAEGVTASLNKATTTLKPVMEGLGKVVDWLANIFSNVLDWAIEKTIQALGWFGRQLQKLGNLVGKDWGQGLIDTADAMGQLAHATNETATATQDLNTDMTTFSSTVTKTREAVDDLLTTYKKVCAEAKKENLFDILMKAGGTKTGQQVIQEMLDGMDKFPEKIEAMQVNFEELAVKGPSALEKFSASYLENAKDIESVSSSLQSSFSSLSSIYEQMAKDETKTEEERAEAARKAKVWSAMQIAANAGTAVAKGVASAVDVGFPAAIPAIMAMTASILAAIAQAKQLASQTYETGGVIGGYRGASMGHDNTAISARTGEMVINANQQRQLFELANGGSRGGGMAAAFAEALANMPAPILDYKEFTEFQDNVLTLDENAKLQ